MLNEFAPSSFELESELRAILFFIEAARKMQDDFLLLSELHTEASTAMMRYCAAGH